MEAMTHYPNNHLLVGASANSDEAFMIIWVSLDQDASEEENWLAKLSIQGECPRSACFSDPVEEASEVRGIVVIDRGSHEEVWIA